MPPEATTSTPAADTQSTSTQDPGQSSSAQSSGQPTTIEQAMEVFNKGAEAGKGKESKTDATKASTKAEKGDKGQTPPAGSKGKETGPDDGKIDWEKADPKLKGAYYKLQRESGEKIKQFEARIKEIEAKPREGAGDAKLIEQYQQQINALKQQLAAASYERSDEYHQKFIEPMKREWQAAVKEVQSLKVVEGTDDITGEPRYRQATEQDLRRIMNLEPGDQDEAIHSMFGKYAARVFARVLNMNNLSNLAQHALQEYAAGHEIRAKEEEARSIREREEYDKAYTNSQEELRQKWPHFFGEDPEDPEGNEALQAGYKYIDDILAKIPSLSAQDRAAYNAVIRARAAGFQRLSVKMEKLQAEKTALEEELAKYRKSDPGGDGKGGGEGGGSGDDKDPTKIAEGGIEAAARVFDRR
jgi:hypothetical protein